MGHSEERTSLERGFRLGDWQIRPPSGEMRPARAFGWPGGGSTAECRHVEPKAMRVLLALARRPGEFRSKDQLIDEVWDGRPVTDDVLTGAIHALRSALGDDARRPRYIETRSNVGYRLLKQPRPLSRPTARRFATAAVAILAVAAVVLVFGAFVDDSETPGAEEPIATIAVLPFMDMSEASDSEYLSLAMTEALILNLARLPGLRVISRTSVMPYADYRGAAATLARELGADLLVEGSVQVVDGEVRVVAQLIEPEADRHLWADDFDRPLDNVLALQQDIAQAVAARIGAVVSEPPQVPLPMLPAGQMHDYLLARYRLARSGSEETEAALTAFHRLAADHPDFAPAHLGIAQALLYLFKQHERGEDVLDEALNSAIRFERLSQPTSESQRCIGQLRLLGDWDFEAAERHYRSAILLNPSDTVARTRYAWLLVALQEFDRAVGEIQQIRLLDPLYYDSPEMANLLMYAGEVDAAVE